MALLTFSEEEFVPLIFASFGGTALMNKSDKGVPQHLRREIDGTAFQYKQEGRIKAHTLRTGTRWKAGMDIHFWKGNPRNKSSNPFHFATAKCTAVQKIEMRLKYISVGGMQLIIKVDGKKLDSRE
ncbi:MAG: hypothetical protein ACPG5P_01115, partial [Saprospiraceae bacterium]